VSVGFGGDQIISGLAINILAVGATEFALRVGFGSASNSPRTPGIAGTLVDPLLLGAILSVPLVGLVISRTVYGLRVRAVGGNAAAATAAGVPVGRVQGTAVIWSGAIAALGGAYLTLDQHQFTDQMTAGRGFIALAAIVFGRRRPVATAAACLLFAAGETLEIHLAARAGMPSQIIGTLPYVVGLGVLVVGRAGARGGL
jgi:simple sugar transport system permease protein